MIPIDKIRNLKILITHGYPDNPCPDGLAAALILRDALPNIQVRFLVHGTRELEDLVPEPGVLFCDIVPSAKSAWQFVEAGAIVLDHHVAARSDVEQFGALGVYADACSEPGVSGAVLAFREIWLPVKEAELASFASFPDLRDSDNAEDWNRLRARYLDARNQVSRFAMLTGIRDTWQRTSPLWREACEQMAALMFFTDWLDVTDGVTGVLGMPEVFRERMRLGKLLLAKAEAETAALVKQAVTYTTRSGTRVAILPSCRISDAANLLDVDVVVGFQFTASESDSPTMRVSLRSRGDHDVSKLASTFDGGGGHKGAAGMTIRVHSYTPHPYLTIREVIARYESSTETPWVVSREGVQP